MYQHEHISLLSNTASKDGDIQPALNKFRTRLATPLNLNYDDDEVGLESIAFNYDWDNLQDDGVIFIIEDNEPTVRARIRKGYYRNGEEMVKALNDALDTIYDTANVFNEYKNVPPANNPTAGPFRKPRFCLDGPYNIRLDGTIRYPVVRESKRPGQMELHEPVEVSTSKVTWEEVGLLISSNLRNMIGFSRYAEGFNLSNADVDHPNRWTGLDFDLNGGIYQLMVYTNIIRHRRVGNTLSQLLRIVQLDKSCKYGERVSITFNPIQYFSPRVIDVTEIEIEIRDDAGKLIPFRKGRTTLELDIRKRIPDDGPTFSKFGRIR